MARWLIGCTLLIALFLPGPVMAADGPTAVDPDGGQALEPIGHLSNTVLALAEKAPYLYAGLPGEFAIFDVTDPAAPRRVGYVILPTRGYNPAYVYDLAYAGDYVYLASNALYVVDASDPQHPRQVSVLDPERADALRRIVVQGNRIYAQSSSNQLLVIDVSDPLTPRLVTTTAVQGESWRGNLAANDRALFVSAGNVIHIYDITGGDPITEIGLYPQATSDAQLVAQGDILFVADGWNGLLILDVSTPAQPRQIGRYRPLYPVEQLTVSGNYAVVGMAGGSTHEVLDVSSPGAPVVVSTLEDDNVADMLLRQTRLYVFDWSAGTRIYDLSLPTQPQRVGSLPPPFSISHVTSDGRYLYGLDQQGRRLIVFDAQDPTDPRYVTDIPGSGELLTISGSFLFNGGDGIRVLDVSDPTQIQPLAYLDPNPGATSAYLRDILAEGVYVYAVDGNTFYVVDVSDPAHPFVTGRLPDLQIIGSPHLAKQGNRIYLATAQAGVHVIDVSNPSQPWRMATWLQPGPQDQGYISAVAANGPYLYLGWAYGPAPERYMGLIVLDGSLVHAPREVAWVRLLTQPSWMHVEDPYLYLGLTTKNASSDQVVVLDVSTPWLPVPVAAAPSDADFSRSVAVTDKAIFVAHWALTAYPRPTDLHATRVFLPWAAQE